MRVDAPGLVASAQRLAAAVAGLGAGGVAVHPPLAADPASVGAAGRLSTAATELSTALQLHVVNLVASLEHLAGVAVTFVQTDQHNAAAVGRLDPGAARVASVAGSAPPPPPVPPDVRAPLPPTVGLMPDALSAAVHSGTAGAGEPFTTAWAQVSAAADDASAHLRSAVSQLPETLDGPASTPAASRHLLSFADGLDHYGDRAGRLAGQAADYSAHLAAARENIPPPQRLTAAQHRIVELAQANAASGGRYAAALAGAVNDKNRLDGQVVAGHLSYQGNVDKATGGDDPGLPPTAAGGEGAGANGAGAGGTGGLVGAGLGAGGADGSMSPENAGGMASMLPQMLPAMLGAAGGLAGGLMGVVTKLPESLMQAGTQAVGAATQGLSGLAQSKAGMPDGGKDGAGAGPDPGLGDAGGGGGGDAPTLPASGGGVPALGVAPSTGAPPTPAIAPVGATAGPGAAGTGGGMGMPMGMPMGGMGGAAAGGGGKDDAGRQRKVVSRDVPHTEDVTGRVDTNRLSVAAASHRERDPDPPDDDFLPDSAKPIVRRLVTRPPPEPT